MENERHYELRSGSRSRSQTPLIQSHALVEPEITEHHYDLRNRSRERSHTPGETISKRPGSSGKIRDQNMEMVIERRDENTTIGDKSEHLYNKSGEFPVATKRTERRSERQKIKRGIFANGQKRNEEDLSGRYKENKCEDSSRRRALTSDYSSEEGEREDQPDKPSSAHEIYKQAGDWWNVFPKTDYTYSEKSQCRYEIAPGVLAMPNMSRRSIHSDTDTSNQLSRTSESGVYETADMENAQNCTLEERHGSLPSESHSLNSDVKSKIQYTKKHVEQYRSHREVIYTVPGSAMNSLSRHIARPGVSLDRVDSRKCNVASSVDSDVELDDAVSISSKSNGKRKVMQQFGSFTTVIVLWFNKLLEFLKLKTVRRREYHVSNEYNRYVTESTWYRIWQNVDHCLHYIYLFMVKVFFFDSWLLSRASNIRRWTQQRSSKVLWIALLPLLILTGTYIVKKQSVVHLDSLHNIPYDIAETSYRIFVNIINLEFLKTDLLVEYVKKLEHLSVNLLPSVNVSLPKMPSIDWNLIW